VGPEETWSSWGLESPTGDYAPYPERSEANVPSGTLVIYTNGKAILAHTGDMNNYTSAYYTAAVIQGKAAPIRKVERFKTHLYVYDDYGNRRIEVHYFSPQGADDDLKRIAKGESINISSCAKGAGELKEKARIWHSNGKTWASHTHLQRFECSRFDSVSFRDTSRILANEFDLTDIGRDPIQLEVGSSYDSPY
jgi:hypothetical protein